jgi:hypothetical protein
VTLKERIDRIFNTGEIELAGEAYKGKYELGNMKSIKNFILDKLRKVYTNLATGNKITLSHNSAGKLARHYKDGEVYQKSLAHIPEIIENMQFLKEMPPDKENASFDNYSYYITPTNIDGESHTILSTVGRVEQEIYYDHNVFKGTPKEVFERAKIETSDPKYDRLNKILQDKEKDSRDPILVRTRETSAIQEATEASTNKYTKNSSDAQGEV